MTDTIPVIDIGDYLTGRRGALQATARRVHDALTTVGFFVLIGHDVPLPLIERTFTEARRFHAMPMTKKLALKLNEHNNGYMVMGGYAVRTLDLDNNDKGDLNEAFWVKRERPAHDPLLVSGRRFVCLNLWPDEVDLPDFRAHVLEYVDTIDRFARRFLPSANGRRDTANFAEPSNAEAFKQMRTWRNASTIAASDISMRRSKS